MFFRTASFYTTAHICNTEIEEETLTSFAATKRANRSLRGDGRQSRPHKPAWAEGLRAHVPSCFLRERRLVLRQSGRVSSGNGSCAFLLRAFSFAHQKKMLKNNDEFYIQFVEASCVLQNGIILSDCVHLQHRN